MYPHFAYVTNGSDNSVSTYAVNAATGRLTFDGQGSDGGKSPSVTVDPSGRYVYVANFNSNSVSQYTIGAYGSLTSMTTPTAATGANPYFVTVDPSGRYVYVPNFNGDTVSQYTIGRGRGSLVR